MIISKPEHWTHVKINDTLYHVQTHNIDFTHRVQELTVIKEKIIVNESI